MLPLHIDQLLIAAFWANQTNKICNCDFLLQSASCPPLPQLEMELNQSKTLTKYQARQSIEEHLQTSSLNKMETEFLLRELLALICSQVNRSLLPSALTYTTNPVLWASKTSKALKTTVIEMQAPLRLQHKSWQLKVLVDKCQVESLSN
jgi:hypothetical protein